MQKKKAFFLDRDGVINVEKDYVHRIEDFEFVDGIFELCRRAMERGYELVVVTNQSGIGRGYYSEADFQALTTWMKERFASEGVTIAAVYHCPYHPKEGVGEYRKDSFDRKPNPGMLLRAAQDLDLDLSASAMIGDRLSDMQAASAAGVGTRILYRNDRSEAGAEQMAHRVVDRLIDVFEDCGADHLGLPQRAREGRE